MTDGIQGDPVSHRTRLNQQPQVAACSATIIDWLSMYGLTNIYRLIGNARHLVLAATRDLFRDYSQSIRLLSNPHRRIHFQFKGCNSSVLVFTPRNARFLMQILSITDCGEIVTFNWTWLYIWLYIWLCIFTCFLNPRVLLWVNFYVPIQV